MSFRRGEDYLMSIARYACIIIIIFIFTSCSLFQKNELKSEYLIPSEADTPGWIKSGDHAIVKRYSAAARKEQFYDAHIIHSISSRFISIDDAAVHIDLVILRFSTSLDAYTFFSSRLKFIEWISDDNTDEYKDDSIFIRRKGNFVIMAENDTSSPFLRGAMAQLVKTVDSNIGDNYSTAILPVWAGLLKDFSGNSAVFSRKELDHFKGIDNVFYSRKGSGKEECFIFISEKSSFDHAFRLYRSIIEREKYITVEALNRHSAILKIKEKNYRFISINGNIITGLWECKELAEGEAILQKLNDLIEKTGSRK
jgi:hypothetical protein